MTSQQMLDRLQQELKKYGVSGYFPLEGDQGVRLEVFNTGDEAVDVYADSDLMRYSWLDLDRHPQRGTPDETLTWLRDFAAS